MTEPHDLGGDSAEGRVPRARGHDLQVTLDLLKRGTSGAFAVQMAGAGAGLISHFVVARLLGKSEYGLYALALSWVSVLAVLAQLGQDASVVRFLPGYCTRDEWGKARGLRRGIGTLVLFSSVAIAIIGCVFVHLDHAQHETAWSRTFYIAFAMLPALTQLQQSSALHRAFKRAVSAGIYTTIARPAILTLFLGGLVLSGYARITAPIAMTVSALAAVLALALSAWHLSVTWPHQQRKVRPEYELRKWAVVGANLSLLSVVIVAGSRLDVLLLGALTGSTEVGAYYAAAQIAGFALYGAQAANVILAPLIAERYDANDLIGLQMIARRAARVGFSFALVACIFFAVTGKWVLGLFGPGFSEAYIPLLILLFGYCAVTSLGEVGFLLSMTQYQRQAMYFALIGVAINGVTTYILVPPFGASGAALGAVVSLFAWRYFALRFITRHLGIQPAAITIRRPGTLRT